jgi:hypothetical protein
VRWLFPETEIRIDTRCLDCGQPITIRTKDEEILEIEPATTVGHVNIPFTRISSKEASWGLA